MHRQTPGIKAFTYLNLFAGLVLVLDYGTVVKLHMHRVLQTSLERSFMTTSVLV